MVIITETRVGQVVIICNAKNHRRYGVMIVSNYDEKSIG